MRLIFILFLIPLFAACKMKKATGNYVQCYLNCNKLLINSDSTYRETINSEIGSDINITGRWLVVGKHLITVPIKDTSILYDSLNNYFYRLIKFKNGEPSVSSNVHPGEAQATKYKLGRNKLIPQHLTTKKKLKSDNCYYVKLTSSKIKNEKLIKTNRINCITKNRFKRAYYRIIY